MFELNNVEIAKNVMYLKTMSLNYATKKIIQNVSFIFS